MARDYSHLLIDLERAETKALEKLNPDQKLSLCMIVKNEEKYLPGALESVQGVVDEIIVVDTGSTDRTVEIAREYGAKVYFRPWDDDFAAARNESLKYATGQWVLIMDADERIPEEKQVNLRALLVNIPHFVSYATLIKNMDYSQGREEAFSHYVVRLFRKTPEAMFYGAVHETLHPSGGSIHLPESSFYLVHLGYSDKNVVAQKQFERNAPLIKKALEKAKAAKNDSAYAFYAYYFSTTTHWVSEKLHWLKEALHKKLNPQEQLFLQVACTQALKCFATLLRYEEGIAFAEEQIADFPFYNEHSGFLDALGLLLLGARQYERAIETFEKILVISNNDNKVFEALQDERTGSWTTRLNLVLAYQRSGDTLKAKYNAEQALLAYPLSDKSLILERLDLILEDKEIAETFFNSETFSSVDEAIQIKNLSNFYLRHQEPYQALLLQSRTQNQEQFLTNASTLATSYIDCGALELAKQVFEVVEVVLPDHSFAELGKIYLDALMNSQLDTAELQPFLQAQENLPTLKMLLHLCLLFSLKTESLQLLDYIEQKGEPYFAELRRALIDQQEGDNVSARNRLQALITHHPQETEAYIQMGNLLVSVKDFVGAEEVFVVVCQLDPSNWYALYGYSLGLLGQGKLPEAKRALSKAAHRSPDNQSIIALMDFILSAEKELLV